MVRFQYPFHPSVTAVARKKTRAFCQKRRWQVSAVATYILRMCLQIKRHCKLMHGCMVYTVLAPRRQQFHIVPAMYQPTALAVTTSVDIKSALRKSALFTDSESHTARVQTLGTAL